MVKFFFGDSPGHGKYAIVKPVFGVVHYRNCNLNNVTVIAKTGSLQVKDEIDNVLIAKSVAR